MYRSESSKDNSRTGLVDSVPVSREGGYRSSVSGPIGYFIPGVGVYKEVGTEGNSMAPDGYGLGEKPSYRESLSYRARYNSSQGLEHSVQRTPPAEMGSYQPLMDETPNRNKCHACGREY